MLFVIQNLYLVYKEIRYAVSIEIFALYLYKYTVYKNEINYKIYIERVFKLASI